MQAVKDVTAALEGSEGEIASLRRLKARHAAEAAVVVAQVAQQDAEIKLAEEQIGLLEDQVEQHEKEMLEHRRQVGQPLATACSQTEHSSTAREGVEV